MAAMSPSSLAIGLIKPSWKNLQIYQSAVLTWQSRSYFGQVISPHLTGNCGFHGKTGFWGGVYSRRHDLCRTALGHIPQLKSSICKQKFKVKTVQLGWLDFTKFAQFTSFFQLVKICFSVVVSFLTNKHFKQFDTIFFETFLPLKKGLRWREKRFRCTNQQHVSPLFWGIYMCEVS